MVPPSDDATDDAQSATRESREGHEGQGPRASDAPEPAAQEQLEEESVETPFDHPLFLPVVLLGLSLWFLWDGFIVPMEEHLAFNRGGFVVLGLATLWFGYKGLREMRETRERRDGTRDEDSTSGG